MSASTIRISFLKHGERDREPRGVDLTWDQLCQALGRDGVEPSPCTLDTCGKGEHEYVWVDKNGKERRGGCRHKYGAAWSPAVYPPGATRSNDNVGVVSLLVIDADHKTDPQLAELATRLAPYQYVAHSSHSDRPGDRALRIVVAMSEPVLRADWRRFRAAALAELGIEDHPDPATKDPARLYFLPSRRSDADLVFTTNDGKAIDVPAVLAKVPPIVERPTAPLTFGDESHELIAHVRDRLRSHGPAVEGSGGNAHTRAAWGIVTNDYALSDASARSLMLEYNATCVPPWDPDELFSGPAREDGQSWNGARGESRREWESSELLRDLFPMVDTPTSTPRLVTSQVASTLYGGGLRAFLGDEDPGDDPDAWLIRGFMPASVPVVFGGHPKSLKTWLALLTAICLAAGSPLPFRPNDPVKRARVLVLAREDSVRETKKRIWRIARGIGLDPRELDGWLEVDSKTPFYFSSAEDVAKMRRTIEVSKPALIIIDSLSRTHQGDENSKKEMSVVTSTWGDLCQQYELAVAPIHHFTKSGEGTLLQKLRGSGDIGALVRHIIGVEKLADGSTELSFEGNLHPLPEPFLVRMVDALTADGKKCVRFEGGESARDANHDRIDREIVAAVVASEPTGLLAREIRDAVKGKNDVINKRRDELVRKELIRKFGARWHAVHVIDAEGNSRARSLP